LSLIVPRIIWANSEASFDHWSVCVENTFKAVVVLQQSTFTIHRWGRKKWQLKHVRAEGRKVDYYQLHELYPLDWAQREVCLGAPMDSTMVTDEVGRGTIN
jgi:hypothetical protein